MNRGGGIGIIGVIVIVVVILFLVGVIKAVNDTMRPDSP